ncbi:hypothetical protein [Cryptosporangium arvum]|uniref:Uncharacterized protein n=1 Tax=Cryptosporangium arvum DSM 44712 TaxID=927661 RepID=A0A010YQ97_9ACTN|nr:hypothetical protein [Cryptosporangium arvum]EXG82365.1 hypothetical protein CryarDRAFT_3543 [Cryptosporangium arvum DSM 44712]
MSAYGPAVFLSRRDGVEPTDNERQRVLSLVMEAAARLRLTDENGEPARPRPYGDPLGVLLYSGYIHGQMPTPIQRDQGEIRTTQGQRVAAEVEKAAPGVYTFEAGRGLPAGALLRRARVDARRFGLVASSEPECRRRRACRRWAVGGVVAVDGEGGVVGWTAA